MNALIDANPFLFDGIAVRTITGPDDEPWFVLRDVLKVINPTTGGRTNDALASIRGGLGKGYDNLVPLLTDGGFQQVTVIAEPAVTLLVSRSNTDDAKRFNKWVHGEVIPSLRRKGCYGSPGEIHEALEILRCMEAEADRKGTAWGIAGNEQRRLRRHIGELRCVLGGTGQRPLPLANDGLDDARAVLERASLGKSTMRK